MIVELLLEHGACVESRDTRSRTPLHVAAANNALLSCHCLLPLVIGRDVDAVDQSQRTALHHAAYHTHTQVLYAYTLYIAISLGCSSRLQLKLYCYLPHSDSILQ